MNNIYTQTADNMLFYDTSNGRNRYKTKKIIKKIYAAGILLALAALISQNAPAQNTNTFQNVRVMNSAKLDYMQDTVIDDRFVVVDKDGNLKASGLRSGGGLGGGSPININLPDFTLPCPLPPGSPPVWKGGNNENIFVCPINTRVGIGVLDPKRKLHVRGITEVCVDNIDNPCLPPAGDDELTNTTYIRISDQEVDEDDGSFVGLHEWDLGAGKSFFINKVSNRVMFAIRSNNRVGIGTGNPIATLDVQRESGDPSGPLFKIHDGHVTKFVVADTGNVGIKRANPAYPLDVNGAVNSSGYFINGVPLQAGLWSSGTGGSINYNGGNVGIGTATPQEKLHVAGNTKVTGKLVVGSQKITSGAHANFDMAVYGKLVAKSMYCTSSGWSDHILKKDYPLASLEEEEDFIEKNGHLKGVPPEDEVMEEGVNLGDMDAILLGEIEKNRLHLIIKNREIAELKRDNEAMEKELLEMKTLLEMLLREKQK